MGERVRIAIIGILNLQLGPIIWLLGAVLMLKRQPVPRWVVAPSAILHGPAKVMAGA